MHTDLIAPSSELSQYVRGQHFGVAAGHINVQVGQGLQIVERIVEGDLLSVRIIGIRNFIRHLNLVYKEIILVCAVFHDLTDMSRKLQWIAIANITGQVQLKGQNVVFCNTLTEKVTLEQIAKQIGLAASADAGDHLHLTVPHEGDDFLQIAVPFDFHNPTSVENLLVLSCHFSMDSIRQRTRKIKKSVEMFVVKPDNISTVRRIPIIQLHEVEKIKIQSNRDLLTLLTCHPYASGGRQRYVVYCERTEK